MLSIQARIDRAQRLLRMVEEDAPLLAIRVRELSPERQASARHHAAEVAARARAELEKLVQVESIWSANDLPQAAD